MSKQGYIKLYRSITDSDIYVLPPLYLRVFERLIIEANHTDVTIPYKRNGQVTEKIIKRGEKLTNIRSISEWVAWYERGILKQPNPKLIKEILDYLQNEGMIELLGEKNDKGNRIETHYKIVNYEVYQDKEDAKVTEEKQNRNRIETEKKQLAPLNNNDKECIKNVKNEKNDKNHIINSYTEDELLRSSIEEFIKMRKAIKKPMTDAAINLMLTKLSKLGKSDDEKIEILNQSIENSWQGIFPISNGNNGNKNKKVGADYGNNEYSGNGKQIKDDGINWEKLGGTEF